MILRELFVKLGLDVDAQSFAKGQIAASVATAAMQKLVEIGTETVHKFLEVIEATAESGHELTEMSQATGLSTTALQQWRKAASFSGVDADALNTGIFRLSRAMVAAHAGGAKQAAAFHKLGVSVTGANGKIRDTDETLMALAESFSKMPDGAEKTALAMEILGRGGAKLIPVFNEGREELEAIKKSAFVMTTEQIAAGKELVLTQKRLAAQTDALWKGAIAPLLPAITDLVKQYAAWRKENAEIMRQRISSMLGVAIRAIKLLGQTLGVVLKIAKGFFDLLIKNWPLTIAAIVIGIGVWVASNWALVSSYIAVQAAAVGAAIATGAAWLVASAPLIALIAIITAIYLIFDDLRVYAKGGDSMFGRFEKRIAEWAKPKADDIWIVVQVKALVRYITEAIQLLKDLDDMTHNRHAVSTASGNKFSPSWKKNNTTQGGRIPVAAGPKTKWEDLRERLDNGETLSMAELAGLQFHEQAEKQKRMSLRAPGGAGAAPVVVEKTPVTQHIYAADGMSAEDVANIAAQKIQEHKDADNEKTAAALDVK